MAWLLAPVWRNFHGVIQFVLLALLVGLTYAVVAGIVYALTLADSLPEEEMEVAK